MKDLILVIVIVWAVVWMLASDLDRQECQQRGYGYAYTTPFFNGYCRLSGDDEIPITTILSNKRK